jgi:hypothetical protein
VIGSTAASTSQYPHPRTGRTTRGRAGSRHDASLPPGIARINVIQQGNENARVQSLVNPVVHLDQDKGWITSGSLASSSTSFLLLR